MRKFGEFSCTLLSLNIPLAMVYNVSVTRTKKKNYKITISNTKATLPFAIITVLSNKAFVTDTRVYINWNENFRTRVFKFSALDRKFQNTSCSNAPKMVIFFAVYSVKVVIKWKWNPFFRKILAGIAFPWQFPPKIERFNFFYLEHLIISYSLWWITYSRINTSILQ